ncbi:MAG: hypothetical protein OEV00_14355, partial [Acidobacteriota bacterium]|nr:hypothetical protein [Acidobacteriota bacterium]
EGDLKGARKQLRNQSNFLSAIDPDDDLPLGTFGMDEGAGRGIGYQKAASVFHMLERKIGHEAMFAGLRLLTAERMGKYTTWEHLREAFEQAAGVELDGFFTQWVRSGGAPLLELTDADYAPGSDHVSVTISQGSTHFELGVPLRLHYGERSEDIVVRIDQPVDTIDVACEPNGLTSIELDPDYHLFRRLKPDEIMPTSSVTKRSDNLLIVVPETELFEGYQVVIDATRRAVLGDDDHPEKGHEVRERTATEIKADDLIGSSLLIVGAAARHPVVRDLLARTHSPVSFSESGFTIDGVEYSGPRQAVYLTVHHPDLAEGGVTVYYGNSAAALSNAQLLGYYGNSLLVFDTPEGAAEIDSADMMPRAEVIRRMDFEFHERVDFPQ